METLEQSSWLDPVVFQEGGLQVLNVESTGEDEAGGKMLREKEFGNAGGNGHMVAEGLKNIFSNRGRDGRTEYLISCGE